MIYELWVSCKETCHDPRPKRLRVVTTIKNDIDVLAPAFTDEFHDVEIKERSDDA